MIEMILPDSVASCEALKDGPEIWLFPEEEAIVARAVKSRRSEFATVRVCARRALAELGLGPSPILPGIRGAPRWPAGAVGSMTHCLGYRAAAVAWSKDLSSIGIDAEPHHVLPEDVLEQVALPSERHQITLLDAQAPGAHWDMLLFSAKESVYKAWFPLTHRWLGFEDVVVTLNPAAGTFVARLLVPGPVVSGRRHDQFAGRWLVRDGLVVTTVTV